MRICKTMPLSPLFNRFKRRVKKMALFVSNWVILKILSIRGKARAVKSSMKETEWLSKWRKKCLNFISKRNKLVKIVVLWRIWLKILVKSLKNAKVIYRMKDNKKINYSLKRLVFKKCLSNQNKIWKVLKLIKKK